MFPFINSSSYSPKHRISSTTCYTVKQSTPLEWRNSRVWRESLQSTKRTTKVCHITFVGMGVLFFFIVVFLLLVFFLSTFFLFTYFLLALFLFSLLLLFYFSFSSLPSSPAPLPPLRTFSQPVTCLFP